MTACFALQTCEFGDELEEVTAAPLLTIEDGGDFDVDSFGDVRPESVPCVEGKRHDFSRGFIYTQASSGSYRRYQSWTHSTYTCTHCGAEAGVTPSKYNPSPRGLMTITKADRAELDKRPLRFVATHRECEYYKVTDKKAATIRAEYIKSQAALTVEGR